MNAGAPYYRTGQHKIPDFVTQAVVTTECGGGRVVATSYKNWRTAYAAPTLGGGMVDVELLTFQMALGLWESTVPEEARFHDLAATGRVRSEDVADVLRTWCETGAVPEWFRKVGDTVH